MKRMQSRPSWQTIKTSNCKTLVNEFSDTVSQATKDCNALVNDSEECIILKRPLDADSNYFTLAAAPAPPKVQKVVIEISKSRF